MSYVSVPWKVAESLDRLLAQINAIAPRRSKVSDGSIGDAAHASRDSDHNPWLVLNGQPLVTARDFTHNPAGGLDGQRLADTLVRAKDSRVKYIIWNRQIIDSRPGNHPWQWMPYTGTNPHQHHVHVSVVADQRCRDASPWMLPGLVAPKETDMPLTDADLDKIADRVWSKVVANSFGDRVATAQVLNGVEQRLADLQKDVAELKDKG